MADVAGDRMGRVDLDGGAPGVSLGAVQLDAAIDGLDRVTNALRKLDTVMVSTSVGVASALVFGAGGAFPFREAYSTNPTDMDLLFKAIRNTIFFYLLVCGGLTYFFMAKRRLITRGDAYRQFVLNAGCVAMAGAEPALREFEDTRGAQIWRTIIIMLFVGLATVGIMDFDARWFLP